MDPSFILFGIPGSVAGGKIPDEEKLVYAVNLDEALESYDDGATGEIVCEKGVTPMAPSIMTVLPNGKFSVSKGTLKIQTKEFVLEALVVDLLTGESEVKIDHEDLGELRVTVFHGTD